MAASDSLTVRQDRALELTDSCPYCGQAISPDFHQHQLEELRKEIRAVEKIRDEVEAEESRTKQEIASAEQKLRVVRGFLALARKLATATLERDLALTAVQESQRGLDQEVTDRLAGRLQAIHSEWDQVEKQIRLDDIRRKETNVKERFTLHARQDELQGQVSPYTEILVRTQLRLAQQTGHLLQTSTQLEVFKTDVQVLNYWAKGLSRSGVQSLLLEGVAAEFNQLRATVFPLLTRGIYDVQFSTNSETAEGDAREKTAFIIRDRDALVSYEVLSGGQRRRIDLGVMLTLALAVAKTRRVPGVLGTLILDEVVNFLDEDGVEALYETLVEAQRTIPSIYVVTHNTALKSLFSNTLLVRQDEHGVSSLILQPSTGE